MAQKTLPQILTDAPQDPLMNWAGFSAKRDKTMLPKNWLVEPSQNCLVPDGDKIVPRPGSQIAFQGSDPVLSDGIIGGYVKFKNFAGIEMDVKSYRDVTAGEQVLVLFNGVYVPITKLVNTAFNGTDRIYFSTYSDTNLNFALNKRIPRLCWVNGYEHSDGTGRVFSWTGGIAAINTIAANVITLPTGQTWRKLGFTENFPLSTRVYVTINGVEFFSTSVAELDTDTLTLNANPTAVPGDIVTSAVEVDNLVAPMDMLRMNKNYMYYGNFMYRQWWMSNQFGRPSTLRTISSNAAQDDLSISPNANYIGTGSNSYRIVVNSVTPAKDTQNFVGTGSNSSYFNTSGYNGAGTRRYRISIISNLTVTCTAGVVPAYSVGEYIIGNTSGAVLKVADLSGVGAFATTVISGIPVVGETFTGQQSGVTSPAVVGLSYYNYGFYYRQIGNTTTWTQITGLVGMLPSGAFQFSTAGSYTLNDGLTFQVPQVGSNNTGDYYELEIQTQAADTFTWQENNGTISAPIAMTTATNITINDGLIIQFGSNIGHSVGDFWVIQADQEITRPWANFYYTLDFSTQNSARKPGEGYVYDIPSNFWTMDTFENSMYLNTSNGEWGFTTPTLSADLKSEDISFTPLKQVGSSKVLYPYLTGHNRNDLLFIDESKNLVSMGRKLMLEKVQMEDMSDVILNKFLSLSFLNGSIKFLDDTTYITSPTDNTMMCYLDRKSYWQPPQVIPNLGLLTIIGNELYAHSYLNTATRRLNDPTAIGDDGVEYEVIIRTGTYDHGNRWNKKSANMGFWEGYIFQELPEGTMKMKLYLDPDGCSDIRSTYIKPILCCGIENNGNFGGGQNGGHEYGGDETVRCTYSRYQWDKMGVVDFYFSSLEFRCRTTSHTYEVLSMGINLAQSKINNKDYRPAESAIDSLLPL